MVRDRSIVLPLAVLASPLWASLVIWGVVKLIILANTTPPELDALRRGEPVDHQAALAAVQARAKEPPNKVMSMFFPFAVKFWREAKLRHEKALQEHYKNAAETARTAREAAVEQIVEREVRKRLT